MHIENDPATCATCVYNTEQPTNSQSNVRKWIEKVLLRIRTTVNNVYISGVFRDPTDESAELMSVFHLFPPQQS